MLLQEPNLKVWLYNAPADMRRQIDGLAALAQTKMQCRANSGELFVFVNRKRTYMKVLYYSKGGFCLWCKRLEQGRFHQTGRKAGEEKMPLSWAQLQCLIDGINWEKAPKNKRYDPDTLI